MKEQFTRAELARMADHQIKKHDVASIWLHWFNAMVWFLLLTTGGGLIVSKQYAFTPDFFQSIMEGVFGTRANMLQFHIWLGVLWIIVMAVYGVFGFRNYLVHFLTNDLVLDRDDIKWLQAKPLQIIGRWKGELPPQGVYNAGQKLYGAAVAVGTVVIMLTGLIMAFHLGTPATIRWAIVLHFLAVGMVFAGLIIHVYMAAILPEERPAFFSMFSGKVPELYAYHHHRKWWREMKREEEAYLDKLAKTGGEYE